MSSRKSEFSDIWTWAQIEKRSKEAEKDTAGQAAGNVGSTTADESHILLVGSQSGGKTSLILKFLERDEPPKPTTALDYTFARKSRGANLAKDVCHIWELGGGTSLTQLIEIPITKHTIHCLSVVVVVDLSKPESIWDTAETVINQIRKRSLEVLSELKTSSPKLVKSLKSSASRRHGDDHPDKQLLNPLIPPTAIIGTKYDLFQEMDPEKKKIISKSLRFMAHTIGAHLVFCSRKSDAQLNTVHQLMSHFSFNGPLNNAMSMDYNKPIIVPVGSDALGQIGAPPVPAGGDLESMSARSPFDLWRQTFTGFFQSKDGSRDTSVGVAASDPCMDKKYSEDTIDTLRVQKNEELQRYIKDCERKEKQRNIKATPTS